MQGSIIGVGAKAEIDQRGGACPSGMVHRLYVLQGVDNGWDTEITVEIHEAHITRRTLLQ
jgi:hypothetical protein